MRRPSTPHAGTQRAKRLQVIIYIYIIILYLYPRVHRIHWRHFSTDEFYDRFFNAIFFHFFFYIASVDVLERIYSEGRETLNRVTLYQRIRGYQLLPCTKLRVGYRKYFYRSIFSTSSGLLQEFLLTFLNFPRNTVINNYYQFGCRYLNLDSAWSEEYI